MSSSGDKTIKLWDIKTGNNIRILTGHNNDVSSTCFLFDNNIIASGSYD
jgi:WD40 repeat protein